jgi:hypothetical protein
MMNSIPIFVVLMSLGLTLAGSGASAQSDQTDVKLHNAANGAVTAETTKYAIQIPAGWTVGSETPWGARDITPKSGAGQMGAMTAGPTKATWEELYKTSMFFIKQEEPGTETPFRTGKTKQGYECMSFEVKNKDGFASRRYTLIRNSAGNVIALSIKIPSPDKEKQFAEMFRHMVDSAKLK